jgi:hypothetical protein
MRLVAVTIALIATSVAALPLTAQRSGCSATKYPPELPSPSALVDSAAAIADLAPFSRSARAMVFSLLYTEDDSLPHIRPLDKPDAIAAVFLMRSLRPQPPSETWAVRVRIVAGASPALTLERSVYCPPVPESTGPNGTIVREIMPAGTLLQPTKRTIVVKLEALVSEDGRPIVVRLMQPSGLQTLDDEIVREWQHRPFQPALLDGYPVQAVYRTDGQSPRL